MFKSRIRNDGVREARDDSDVFIILHDHEIAPNPSFALACREAYFVDPMFLSVSRRDMLYVDAQIRMAAARDIEIIRDRVSPKVWTLLSDVIEILRDDALKSTSAEAIMEIEAGLSKVTAPAIVPSEGPEFEDEVWLAGIRNPDAASEALAEESTTTAEGSLIDRLRAGRRSREKSMG